MAYDAAWRPASLSGEGLTLVSNVAYNPAGGTTGFVRNDGVNTFTNTFEYNSLNQITRQLVKQGVNTTLQDLNYTYSPNQNNGQILSQTDALSGETVVYEYNRLNHLIRAETTSPRWGLQFSYDGFGNRTNQTVTKGTGPNHSVTIQAATNRILTAGYVDDANGNLTQMPLMTMTYDIANRMVSSDHSSIGAITYRYNHANQRVYMKSGSKISYFLYGLGGERLLEMEEQCNGNCWNYQETQRWIYFAGGKMFQKTGTVLKAVTPNRLSSEAKHYPYGETDGTPPSDTKDYFATYRRDGTNLDYAWNRYYSPTMGRFTTADPYGGSASPNNPQSWNRYSYTNGNPVNRIDPDGLLTIIMGGTALQPWGRSDADWGKPGTPFHRAVSNYFGEEAVVIEWRGQPYTWGSAEAALANYIAAYDFAEGEKLNVVAHSHGGNVVKNYTWKSEARFIDVLVTLGTPQWGFPAIKRTGVGTYLNVYSRNVTGFRRLLDLRRIGRSPDFRVISLGR
ncbi:MAG: RHS repeat-associated core domain-containing protein [Bryobacterales bacterium]|nr:RHS repeat-associated core domain-containing protein [Bryobacterales bacterium]